jgi:hypothetical protein
MRFLGLQAFWKLIYFDSCLAREDFAALYERVRSHPLATRSDTPETTARVCAAVDMACIWYWKEVLCLQRSAAAACLLKQYGVPAQMMIGAQQMPFKAHAWVEVAGHVVNDKPYMREMYAVIESC